MNWMACPEFDPGGGYGTDFVTAFGTTGGPTVMNLSGGQIL